MDERQVADPRDPPEPPSAGPASEVTEPLYLRCHRILGRSIRSGRLRPGTVLLEGHLAEIFGSSRAPVRQALARLRREKLVSRFAGRGHIVGRRDGEVRRIGLSPDMLDIDPAGGKLRKAPAWATIYEAVEREIIHRSAFGRFRVNELELARHHRVGRTVARDVLTRIESLGMLAKDERQRWTIVQLDRERLVNLYEIREQLEPLALARAQPTLSKPWLRQLRRRLAQRLASYPEVSAGAMDDLEFDLHVRCLAPCPNKELLDALLKTRCVLTLSKHVLGVEMDVPEHDPFMAEHIDVVDALLRGRGERAPAALRDHLRLSCPKVVDRLERFRRTFTPAEVPYIS